MKFITFAAGEFNGKKYKSFAENLIKQAKNTKLFSHTVLYDDDYLKNDKEFWGKHGNFILNGIKVGYGYWLWKPFVIKKAFENMLDGDVLLYLDCCCEIDVRKSKEIEKLAKKLEKDLIADCLSVSPDKYYCKMDLVKYLNLDSEINKQMHQAGALMFYKCKKTTDFVNNWYSVCCNHNLIDNSPSKAKNNPYFRAHRNDQSIYSLLVKQSFNTNNTLENCIEYIRNKYYGELCGYKLMKDKYINSDSKEIFAKLKNKVSNNDINTIFELANCYYEGYGTEINYNKSIELYKKAANSNHTEALYWLGTCVLFEKGGLLNNKNAQKYFIKARNNNHKLADILLRNKGL